MSNEEVKELRERVAHLEGKVDAILETNIAIIVLVAIIGIIVVFK